MLGAKLGGKRLDALLEGITLIGQRDFRTLGGAGFGYAPGDGPVVGDTHDQTPLAGHQIAGGRACMFLRCRHRLIDP